MTRAARRTLPSIEDRPSNTYPRQVQPDSDLPPAVVDDEAINDVTLGALEDQLALLCEANSRNEAGIAALCRAFQYAENGLGTARRAQQRVAERLRELLQTVNTLREQRGSLREQLNAMTLERERLLREAAREREQLILQHDAFVRKLIEEHEIALRAARSPE